MRSNSGGGLSTERKSVILVPILFVDLVVISSQIMLRSQQSLLQTIVANMVMPLQLTVQRAGDFLSRELGRYVFQRGIFRKYQQLKRRQAQLWVENVTLKRQLRDLRMLAAARSRFPRFLLASVISVDVNFPYAAVTIDKGIKAGLVENDVVLNRDAELVGRVAKPLTAFSAAVRLITNPVGGTGAAIEANMLEGLLRGDNGPECRFEYLLATKPVRPGDRVVTSGTDLIYPSLLPIGTVTEVLPDTLTQRILVRPYFVDKPIHKLVVLLHE